MIWQTSRLTRVSLGNHGRPGSRAGDPFSLFLATFFQILSSCFFAKIILHSLCLDSCQLFLLFLKQHRNIDPCCFSSLVSSLGKEIKFGKVELTNSRDQEHVFGVNAYLAGVDEDSGRSGRSKLARRREARIAQDHGFWNRFLLS